MRILSVRLSVRLSVTRVDCVNANRKSTARFPMSLRIRWSSYVARKSSKGGLKNAKQLISVKNRTDTDSSSVQSWRSCSSTEQSSTTPSWQLRTVGRTQMYLLTYMRRRLILGNCIGLCTVRLTALCLISTTTTLRTLYVSRFTISPVSPYAKPSDQKLFGTRWLLAEKMSVFWIPAGRWSACVITAIACYYYRTTWQSTASGIERQQQLMQLMHAFMNHMYVNMSNMLGVVMISLGVACCWFTLSACCLLLRHTGLTAPPLFRGYSEV